MTKPLLVLAISLPSIIVGLFIGYFYSLANPSIFAPWYATEQDAKNTLDAYFSMDVFGRPDGEFTITQTNTGAWVIFEGDGMVDPLTYTLSEDLEAISQASEPITWYSSKDSACSTLADAYNNRAGVAYAFMSIADREAIEARGESAEGYAYRVIAQSNIDGYTDLQTAQDDFLTCRSDEAANWWPIDVSEDWIVYSMGCEGMLEGCGTARDLVGDSVRLKD